MHRSSGVETYIGFDSAWTDNPKAPGAICAVRFSGQQLVMFREPRLATFDQALAFIRDVHVEDGTTLIALDQPTIVPNATSMRPVERVAASLVSWIGGGVQPSNQGRRGMFCPASPIWRFLARLEARENPEQARTASKGLFVIEVFPALALASFHAPFCARLSAPRYNPARKKTFAPAHWIVVAEAAAHQARLLGCEELASWCRAAALLPTPGKPDQDRLDSALCVLIALHWRRRPRAESAMLGDLATGYMITPAAGEARVRLQSAAARFGVPMA
jgi:predicted RNase H-like nuclease